MKILGLNGSMGSGKSTSFNIIKDLFPGSVGLVKFAQPLYDMQESIYDRIKSVHARPADFIKDRKLLQWLGTDWGRQTIRDTLWIDLWKAKVAQHAEEGTGLVVVDDVRFDNEAQAIRDLGGMTINIQSDAALARMAKANLMGIQSHASEKGLPTRLVDRTVYNNYTMDELRARYQKTFGEQLNI